MCVQIKSLWATQPNASLSLSNGRASPVPTEPTFHTFARREAGVREPRKTQGRLREREPKEKQGFRELRKRPAKPENRSALAPAIQGPGTANGPPCSRLPTLPSAPSPPRLRHKAALPPTSWSAAALAQTATPPEQKHTLHPTPLSPAHSLGRPYLKDAAAPPRPCVMASPVTQWAGPSPGPQTPGSLPWKLRQDLLDTRLRGCCC